jgi:Glycosyltransferase
MRVLHIAIDTAMGGIESFLLNIYSRIDRNKIQFDFIEYGDIKREFDYQYSDLGAKIYKISDRKKHPFLSAKQLKSVIKNGGYSVVHIHKNSLSDISAIRICQNLNVPAVIVHSHNSGRDNKIIVMFHKWNRFFVNMQSIHKFACSVKAAEWMYGLDKSVTIINNGIDTKRFEFNPEIRTAVRFQLNIENNFVIGSTGRLTEQKNPFFAIELIHKLRSIDKKYKLLWVGDGVLKNAIQEQIKRYHEEDGVIFTGAVDNPENYYQAMDAFIMPSYYEGFPIAAIEAQDAGLPCILSENITSEVQLTENVYWRSLDTMDNWIEILCKIQENDFYRKGNCMLLYKQGFDINSTVEFLEKFYLKYP